LLNSGAAAITKVLNPPPPTIIENGSRQVREPFAYHSQCRAFVSMRRVGELEAESADDLAELREELKKCELM
jgi:hypothetical protein